MHGPVVDHAAMVNSSLKLSRDVWQILSSKTLKDVILVQFMWHFRQSKHLCHIMISIQLSIIVHAATVNSELKLPGDHSIFNSQECRKLPGKDFILVQFMWHFRQSKHACYCLLETATPWHKHRAMWCYKKKSKTILGQCTKRSIPVFRDMNTAWSSSNCQQYWEDQDREVCVKTVP